MDAPDVRQRPDVSRRRSTTSSSRRGARSRTTPDRSGLQTLTDIVGNHYSVERGGLGAERLGPVAQGGRKGRRDGPDGRDRDRVHRTVSAGRRQGLRVAGDLSGRAAALPAPRPVHAQAALRLDGHPIPVRHALRRRGEGRGVRAAVEGAEAAGGRAAVSRRARAARVSGGTGDRLAGRGVAVLPEDVGDRGREGPGRELPGAGRGGVDGTGGVRGARRRAVGGRVGEQVRRVRLGHVLGDA